jgi:hypothetical protein
MIDTLAVGTAFEGIPYEILGYGLFVEAATIASIASITWNGDTTWFMPVPTASVAPVSISVADYTTAGKGVMGTFTGFAPGETVDIYISNGYSGDPVSTATVDVNGAVTANWVATAPQTPGTYFIGAYGNTSQVNVSASFTVVANVLPTTGVELAPAALGAVVMLLIGAGIFGAIAIRRRGAAARA